jgi:hypothetical protein
MVGLAEQMANPIASGMQQMPTVEEVIQLLMEGMDPQQLLEMGVPEELLMQALQILEQQMQQQPSQPQQQPQQQPGLAQAMAV